MIYNGTYNTLKVLRDTSVGFYLGDDEGNDVLLPNKYVPKDLEVDQKIKVFIYQDSEDRLIATTLIPLIEKDKFASLKVKDVNRVGAFVDIGLEKDLLVPFKEQRVDMQVGHWYIVYMYLDLESGRLAGSTKLNQFFENEDCDLNEGDEVTILVSEQTEIGYKVVIEELYSGLLYKTELFRQVKQGFRSKAFIKKIRDDGKIDVTLQKQGFENVEPNSKIIVNTLKQYGGYLALNDKSHPDEIKSKLEMSKKTFKKSIGVLYKQKVIDIKNDGIYLL
jgi:predicted RNA-binding protein (virulence factor B family)